MTWQSKVMPDDAPELAGSLVGTMLQGDGGNKAAAAAPEDKATALLEALDMATKPALPPAANPDPAPVPELKGDWFYEYEQWLAKELPPGTVIGDPLWWAHRIARAATSRFLASPKEMVAPVPVPVAEQLPGAADCDAQGRCWWHMPSQQSRIFRQSPTWCLGKRVPEDFGIWTHWLPHWALPMPEATSEAGPH